MRAKTQSQMTIFDLFPDHTIGQELKAIAERLEKHPEFLDWVAADLDRHQAKPTGAKGLTVENVFRAAFLKRYTGFSYRELEFYLTDSRTFTAFTRLFDRCPDHTTLQATISAIRAETWERINQVLLRKAATEGLEKGRVVRTDSTVVETNIHKPSDSSLLGDSVKVMTRLLLQGEAFWGGRLSPFQNHTKVCKRLVQKIQYQRGPDKRLRHYKRLLKYTRNVVGYLGTFAALAGQTKSHSNKQTAWLNQVYQTLERVSAVLTQTIRRVVNGESVPSEEKIVSLFESHTDIIVKGRRDTQYGHKINLTTGQTGLILDLVIEEGNPADSSCAVPMIERQIAQYGRAPRQAAFDGGYASKENVKKIKDLGVKDVAFHKKRGLQISDMVRSTWVFKKLRAFRAGIEGTIGTLKTKYGLRRCYEKGIERFKSSLWGSILAYNLVTLTRLTTNQTC